MRVVRIEMAIHSQVDSSDLLEKLQELAVEMYEDMAGKPPTAYTKQLLENVVSVQELSPQESDDLLLAVKVT